jgi:transposase
MALMPWKTTEPMTEKEQFITLAQTGRYSISELCKDYGISRKTGHKYLKRYEEQGLSRCRIRRGSCRYVYNCSSFIVWVREGVKRLK